MNLLKALDGDLGDYPESLHPELVKFLTSLRGLSGPKFHDAFGREVATTSASGTPYSEVIGAWGDEVFGDKIVCAHGMTQITPELYHSDPFIRPTLSNSLAKVIIDRSPYHAMLKHPRLTPEEPKKEYKANFSFGSAVHALLLGVGMDRIKIIDANDFRGGNAKIERDDALARDHSPILRKDFVVAQEMADVARQELVGFGKCADAFDPERGESEVAFFWENFGVDHRGMVDRLMHRNDDGVIVIYDYKTIGTSADPETASKQIFEMGYDMQHALYEEAVEKLCGDGVGRVEFRFIFQETTAPFSITIQQISYEALEMGREKIGVSRELWKRCLDTGNFPSYPSVLLEATPKPWVTHSWQNRIDEDNSLIAAKITREKISAPHQIGFNPFI